MKRIVIIFGLLSGAIVGTLMSVAVPLSHKGLISSDSGEVLGYTSMVLAFLMVFFGIRSYRENVGGGMVSFGKAFTVGILITLIACVVYVAVWEVLYFNFMPDFADKYAAQTIEKVRARGASDAEIAKTIRQMTDFKRMYRNPVINVGMTFMEIFPVGLIVTLLSAAILRRRTAAA